jgi:hypothetical protein
MLQENMDYWLLPLLLQTAGRSLVRVVNHDDYCIEIHVTTSTWYCLETPNRFDHRDDISLSTRSIPFPWTLANLTCTIVGVRVDFLLIHRGDRWVL